jgi:hypothetical protein
MNMKKVKFPDGSEHDAVSVPVDDQVENWNQYTLSDGTVLRFKSVVTEVLRVKDEWDPEGNPMYMVKSNNLLVPSQVPDRLRRKE